MCAVDKVDGVVAGVSCKDWSRANPQRFIAKGASVLKAATSAGGSAQTMIGLCMFVNERSPIWAVLENSDELAEEENADWNKILFFFQSHGYRCHTCIIESTEFCLPARRRRAYLVALLITSKRHSLTNALFPTF